MLEETIAEVVAASREAGWVLEPDAKRLLAAAGIPVPDFRTAGEAAGALAEAERIGYPLVAKVVSPRVLHKSDVRGVSVGVEDAERLAAIFARFQAMPGFAGMLLEPMVAGMELIVGAKNDHQFGPVVLVGMGGTGAEIYRDTALRMAPLEERDVRSMIACLRARPLLEGYRGEAGIDVEAFVDLVLRFSDLVMRMGDDFESADLNPVLCGPEGCVAADARIILSGPGPAAGNDHVAHREDPPPPAACTLRSGR